MAVADHSPKPVRLHSTGVLLAGGIFMALGVLFPVVFHILGLGPVFLPMFYPILLAGFLLPWPVALAVGIFTPLLSNLLTQMPPLFILPVMMAEGVVLATVPKLARSLTWVRVTAVTAFTLLIDRVLVFVLVAALAPLLHIPPKLTALAATLQGLPGCLVIVVVIPILSSRMAGLVKY